MSLQRRRELARLSKPELIDLVVSLEFARMPDADAGRALGLFLAGRQVMPDTEIHDRVRGGVMGRQAVETSSYIEFARRIIRGAGKRVSEADDWELAELVSLRDEVDDAIRRAVQGQRKLGRSWQYIGDALGITRQSARTLWEGCGMSKAVHSLDLNWIQ